MFDRYIISGESVQMLSMDVHTQEIPLPSPAHSPPYYGRKWMVVTRDIPTISYSSKAQTCKRVVFRDENICT